MYQQGGMRNKLQELGTWERSQSLLEDRGQQRKRLPSCLVQDLVPNSHQQFGNY
jgi:hypothetical protein